MAKQGHTDHRNRISTLLIKCVLATIAQSPSGAILGNVYVELDSRPFPDVGWSDFVVVILCWWIDRLAALTRGQKTAVLSFMDGPFEVRASDYDGTTAEIELVRRGTRSTTLAVARINTLTLLSSIELVAADVIAVCDPHSWDSDALERLRESVRRERVQH